MTEVKQNMFGKSVILETHFVLHSPYKAHKGLLSRKHQSIAAGNVSFGDHFG